MMFLDNLTVLLNRTGISRTRLATMLGIPPSTVNSWYNKGYKNVSLRFVILIADFFGVSIDKLVRDRI